jgi:hypothetical protein
MATAEKIASGGDWYISLCTSDAKVSLFVRPQPLGTINIEICCVKHHFMTLLRLNATYPARFPSCICSTMENAFPQKPRRSWVRDRGSHRVGLDQPPAVSRAHGRCRQSQRGQSHTSQSPRARVQSRTRKVGTITKAHGHPHCFCQFLWEGIFHRATNAAGKSARFPICICSTMEMRSHISK